MWRYNGDMLGEVRIPDDPSTRFNPYQCHPAILDACLQTLGAGVATRCDRNRRTSYLHTDPYRSTPGLRSVRARNCGVTPICKSARPIPSRERCGCWMGRGGWRSRFWDYASISSGGMRTMRLRRIRTIGSTSWQWQPMEHLAGVQPQGESVAQSFRCRPASEPWLILADSGGVGKRCRRSVTSAGRSERPGLSRTILRARGRRAFSHQSGTAGGPSPMPRGGAAIRSDQLPRDYPFMEP